MASKTIKGLTVEIGGDTTKLGKALENVEKKSSNLSSELGQINKLLKLDPTNTELLAQKQKVLADAVENTEEKLDTLKEAEKQVQKQFEKGEASEEQVRALQREIIATEKKLNSYKSAVKETAAAVDKLGDNSDKAADDVEDLAEKEDKAEKESEDLGSSLDGTLSGGLKGVAALAAAAATAIIGTVEATQEYRNAMGRLDTAFQSAEHSSEAAKKTYKELQSIMGDTDTAVEASTLLAQFCDNEEELAEMTNTLAGVYARFPDSLPVEALVESANETMRTGQIAGNLADALNWAAAEGENFGVTLKANTAENEEWNKAVEEAASAEDYFNLALQECSDEQERQQLIMDTLNRLYGAAGTQYKKTNKAVIEANKANEDWTATMAEVGEEVQPVVTELKKFGTTLLKDAQEPIEDTAEFISDDLLPALLDMGKWVKKNGPFIKNTLIGITATLVAYKTACIATEVAHKGLKGAIMATTVAQKTLNLAQKASPIGLMTTAVIGAVGLVSALTLYAKQANTTSKEVNVLTEEEKELIQATNEAGEAFREQMEASKKSSQEILSQMGYVEDLAKELETLADSSGKVKEEDQARVDFILGELNNALGTEYERTGDVIAQYDALRDSIYKTIEAKKANLLLEEWNDEYVTATKKKVDAQNSLSKAEEDYLAQKEKSTPIIEQLEKQLADAKTRYYDTDAFYTTEQREAMWEAMQFLQQELDAELEALGKKETAYNQAKETFTQYYTTVDNYETASQAILEGNYQQAIEILAGKADSYTKYSETVDTETAKVIDTLRWEAIEAGEKAKLTKERFEDGVDGYTKEMVDEAESAYQEALGKFGSAYSDAYGLGEDFGQGLADGIKIKNGAVGAAAIAQIREAVKAAKKEAEINSPSKKTMKVGEGMGEGAEVGIKKSTPNVVAAAEKQVGAMINVYEDQNITGQQALRNVAAQQAAQEVSAQMLIASSNGPMLERILTAIEKGQVLTIDGDTLVGATAQRMDGALGQRRILAARGAIK